MRIALALLAACGGHTTDIQPTLVLADRSDPELARLVAASGGGDMFAAQAHVDELSFGIADPCPAIAIAGKRVMISGGCTTKEGIAIGGSATVTNPAGWDAVAYDFNADSIYQLDQLSFDAITYDGVIRISDGSTTHDADLTADDGTTAVRSDLYYSCDRGSVTCSLEGSGLALVGVGGVHVAGSVVVGGTPHASFTLQGVDRMTVSITQGCVAWQISGSDRQQVCQ